MNSHASIFKHTPLDATKQQIRLLKLCQHRTQQYRLHIFDVTEAPLYIALSYTWGPPGPSHYILINGKRFKVLQNLFDFLSGHHNRNYIWIDQICIDQTNTQERNHQVKMMSTIYKDCEYVIAWLGSNSAHFRNAVHDYIRNPHYTTLDTILQDDYFTRLWVIQEILLAREARVHCRSLHGRVRFRWTLLGEYIARSRYHSVQNRGIEALLFAQGITHYTSLAWLLAKFCRAACADPRDSVYGLLGLARLKDRVVVDYTKSKFHVYLDAVHSLHADFLASSASRYNYTHALLKLATAMGFETADFTLYGTVAFLERVFSHSRSVSSRITASGVHDSGYKYAWWLERNERREVYHFCICKLRFSCSCNDNPYGFSRRLDLRQMEY